VGWRGIFWVNVPIGLAAIVLTGLFVPESRAPRPRRIDPVGQLLIIVTLGALTYAIIEGPGSGWAAPKIIFFFALAAAALAVLLVYEPRRDEPLINLQFFRSVPFAGAAVTAVSSFAALGGFLFVNTLYLQDARGFSALAAGLYTLPTGTMVLIFAQLSGRLVASRGPRLPLVLAGLGITVGCTALTGVASNTSTVWLLASYVIFGMGFGLVNVPITTAAVSGMPVTQAGVAAGIASASRQVGQSLGVAVVGSIVTAGIHGPLRTSFATASHVGWWTLAGCGVAVFCLGLITTSRWAVGTAARTAAKLQPGEARTPARTP
jgi:MFS family permease